MSKKVVLIKEKSDNVYDGDYSYGMFCIDENDYDEAIKMVEDSEHEFYENDDNESLNDILDRNSKKIKSLKWIAYEEMWL